LPAFCLLVASCSTQHASAHPDVLFSLETGRYWKYQVTRGERASTVENTISSSKRIGDIEWFESIEYGDRYWIRNGNQGQVEAVNLYTKDENDAVFEQIDPKVIHEELIFKYPATPGDRWETLENTLRFEGTKSMDVPAGHFTCLMYSITQYGQTYSHSCIAPGVGVVYSDNTLPDGGLEVSRLIKWGKK
jgi:hypothetical protein